MIADLRHDGIVVLPAGLSTQSAECINRSLLDKQTYGGHVKGASVAAYPSGSASCWAPEDVLAAPYLMDFALNLMPVVEEYLGQPPLMYSVNAFTTYPHEGPLNPDIQEFHRDKDDVRFVALFVYLTDVLTAEQGAHQFKVGTHKFTTSDETFTVLGHAGTAFLADTRGLHRGLRPLDRPRTMAWVRWGVSCPPASYVWDGQRPASREAMGDRFPTDPRVRDSIRLVVQ